MFNIIIYTHFILEIRIKVNKVVKISLIQITDSVISMVHFSIEYKKYWNFYGDALKETVIVLRNGIGVPCSNPDETAFQLAPMPLIKMGIH